MVGIFSMCEPYWMVGMGGGGGQPPSLLLVVRMKSKRCRQAANHASHTLPELPDGLNTVLVLHLFKHEPLLK
jgi:hypothetical protein